MSAHMPSTHGSHPGSPKARKNRDAGMALHRQSRISRQSYPSPETELLPSPLRNSFSRPQSLPALKDHLRRHDISLARRLGKRVELAMPSQAPFSPDVAV